MQAPAKAIQSLWTVRSSKFPMFTLQTAQSIVCLYWRNFPEVDNSPQNGHVIRMFPVYGPRNWAILN